jgi:hypothetical protein
MTDRERLIELIRKAKKNTKGANCDLEREMLFADYLLDNGVIVPPCNVGDTVYQIDDVRIYQGTVAEIVLNKLHVICVADITCFDERAIGKTVFLTREEAEKALAERSANNV